ncbi:hypothetical protein AB0P05_45575 [Streptomyces flaveolus]|uniref:hypothetical protein n=1 Tax=Streptomyces flaveolus TaxID=67297 RepID=UPI0034205363
MPDTLTLADEMPDAWVSGLVDAIERRGWTVADAHESAVTLELTPTAAALLDAARGDVLAIGWSERYGVDWGVSTDGGATVPDPRPLTDSADAETIAAGVDRVLLAGRADARLVQHAVPGTAPSPACSCQTAQPCGGLIPDPDCPEHGDQRAPHMWWHWEGPACTH